MTAERKDPGVTRQNRDELVLIVFEISDPQEKETAQCCMAQTSEILTL